MSLPGHVSGSGSTSSGREFSRVRKGGLDPSEVQAHIDSLEADLRRARDVERQLRAELDDRPAERVDELDPSVISRALGEETVRIIDAAREAAEDIRAKAEENAARVVRDAHDRASRVTREAIEARDAAATEAEELTSSARETADALVGEARTEAEDLRAGAEAEAAAAREAAATLIEQTTSEAELEAERIRTEATEVLDAATADAERARTEAADAATAIREQAELDAEAMLEDVREQGREMIREAKEARERMIRDLAERRHASRQQLEALRAARERLIETFGAARVALDEATDELVDSLPAAREDAADAARAVEVDLDAATEVLDDLISRGADVDELFEADGGSRAASAAEAPAVTDEAPATEAEAEAEDAGSDEPDIDDAADIDDIDTADDEPVAEEAPEFDAPAVGSTSTTEEITGSHLRLVASNADGPRPVGVEALTDVDGAEAADAAEQQSESDAATTGRVEELFARLRADHATEDDDFDDDDDDDEDDDFDDEDDEEIDDDAPRAVVIDLSSVDAERAGGEDDAGTDGTESDAIGTAGTAGTAGEVQDLLDRRDDLVDETARGVSRRLRRVVTDQENELLDLIRRQRRARTSDELVATRDDQIAAYRGALDADLRELLVAGSMLLRAEAERIGAPDSVVDPDDATLDAAVDALADTLGEWAVDPLRTKLARIIDDSDDTSPDRSELVDRIRATYREWRNERLAELSGDLTTLALNRGILAAAPAGRRLRWMVDHGGLGCADGEDNQLAGPTVAGEAFPTGDVCPPAHPGCRCLLVPAAD